MFSLTYNRVYTEKPFFNPTYELFKSFYEDYFILHPSLKELNHFEIGMCGKFMRADTWDIDIRLMGNPNPVEYEIISDFFMDVVNTGLNKYRIFVDIHLLSKPNSIEEYNYNFNSRSEYLYIEKYVDYKKQFARYGNKYYKLTDLSKGNCKIKKVSDNLWRVNTTLVLKDYIKQKGYINGKVPKMIEISKYKELI